MGQHIVKHLQENDTDVKEIRIIDLKAYKNNLSTYAPFLLLLLSICAIFVFSPSHHKSSHRSICHLKFKSNNTNAKEEATNGICRNYSWIKLHQLHWQSHILLIFV